MKFKVIKGLGQGSRLGFPTINLQKPAGFRLTQGVYACCVEIGAKSFFGALYFGPKYNFGILKPALEVHLIDFSGATRARYVKIDIVKRMRAVRKFVSIAALARQIKLDIIKIKKQFKNVKLA